MFQLEKEKKINHNKENISIRKQKFQSVLLNWEMAEQQEGKNICIRPREGACGQKVTSLMIGIVYSSIKLSCRF